MDSMVCPNAIASTSTVRGVSHLNGTRVMYSGLILSNIIEGM